jgi:hypothetical protein
MATKKLVPRATNEGGLGTALKVWGASWLQNLTITNLQTSTSVSGLVENAGNVEKRNLTTIGIDVQDTEDTTCYVGLWRDATGTLLPKTDEMLTYNALTNILKVGSSTVNTSYYSNTILSEGAPFNIRSTNNRLTLSASDEITVHSDADDINFTTGNTPVQVGHLSALGLIINNIQAENTPTKILVENTTHAGLVSYLAMSSIVPNLQTLDEGSSLTATTQSINYVGDGVTTTVGASNDTTVTIPGVPTVSDTENSACFLGMYEAATGALSPKTDESLTYDALNEILKLDGYMELGAVGTNTPKIIRRASNTNTAGGDLSVHAGITTLGTNTNGGDLQLASGGGTGNGSGGYGSAVNIWTSEPVASGTSAQASQFHTQYISSAAINITKQFSGAGITSYLQTQVFGNGLTQVSTHDVSGSNAAYYKVLAEGYILHNSATSIHFWTGAANAALGSLTSMGLFINNIPTESSPTHLLVDNATTPGLVSRVSLNTLTTESFMMACSDETTALTAGTNKVKFRMPYAFTVTEVRASLSTAGTGAQLVTVDINESGTSILSTKITIDATETTSVTAETVPVISDASLADDAEMTVDIDLTDTGGVSKGLKVSIIGHKTV